MFRQTVRMRAFDQRANELYLSAKMPGLTHMYIGQENVAVGVCKALDQNDYINTAPVAGSDGNFPCFRLRLRYWLDHGNRRRPNSCMTRGNYQVWIATILIGLMFGALLADTFGWFGVDKIPLRPARLLGILLCIIGALLALY
jgi:uncharacterized membrane protein YeaQ/YmgE (transglycosylase-associated protein family)